MIVYESTKGGFVSDVRSGRIATIIEDQFAAQGIGHNNESEYPVVLTPQDTHQDTPQDTLQGDVERKIWEYCKTPHSKKEILDYCELNDAHHLTQRYLKPMLEQGYLGLTIPEKPTSKNQKYKSVFKQ